MVRLLCFLLTGVGDAFILSRRTASHSAGAVKAVQRTTVRGKVRGRVISHFLTKQEFTRAKILTQRRTELFAKDE
jgi:hypothetical protein